MIDFRQVPREERGPLPPVVFTIQPIGIVHVAPRRLARPQKYFVSKGRAALELFRPYIAGLQGLYEGMDLWVLTYHPLSAPVLGERGQGSQAHVGVFASTTLERPNPIEFLRAKVLTLDPAQGLLHVEGLDADDGAPILDIRPATSPRHRLLRSGEEMSPR